MVDRVGASYLHFDIQPGVPISLAGPAKVIDDDTIVVAGQLTRISPSG
jgi:hypothetical protein